MKKAILFVLMIFALQGAAFAHCAMTDAGMTCTMHGGDCCRKHRGNAKTNFNPGNKTVKTAK